MNGIKYLFEKAKSVDKPLSLFISLGTSQGGHDERGSLSSYLSYLAVQKNVCVSIAAGNEGNSGHHYMGSVLKGAKYDTVELKVGPKVSGFSMELWGTSLNLYSLDILSPTGEYIPRIPARLNESREIRFIFERTTITVDYQIVEAQSGDQLILMRFLTPTEGIWRFRVYANESLASSYHIWLPIRQFLSSETEFVTPNPYYTLTSPGNTFIPIVATAYNHMNNSLYESASRGYMRSDYIAPSLAAPGVNMVGPSLNNSYTTLSGSSISAAHAAGIGAILLEWGIIRRNFPQIGTVEIRNLLIRGAIRDPNLTYPNKEWGYGIMDLYNTFDTLRAENP
jgi:subtilisin family serine protease